jgi:hypothetical protein
MIRYLCVLQRDMLSSLCTFAKGQKCSDELFSASTLSQKCCFATYKKKVIYYIFKHVRWVPCHHGMARPQVADGGKASGYGG